MAELELVPEGEAAQIDNVIKLTVEQIRRRYPGESAILRGVHAKDHGCVAARFTVLESLPEELRVGVFATPGRQYDAWIRYSNAAAMVAADSPVQGPGQVHGSRGMAVKLLGVAGSPLMPVRGPLTQDFLMVNHPVFAIANVEDYEALSEILVKDNDNPGRFFTDRIRKKPDGTPDSSDPMTQRALRSLGIVKRIQSLSLDAQPPAYQAPPASPVDNEYFSAAPFLFGEGRAIKFRVRPLAPQTGRALDLSSPHYLRNALRERLTKPGAEAVTFEFQVQVRTADELAGKIETEIEDACFVWEESRHPFITAATIEIPPQDFEAPERQALCEKLIFTPWHGIAEHRPLGGINRMRRAVYDAAACFRHLPKEPSSL